ncbi:6630_t:CDS:10 [Ambispora gerdemannii]|uniref:6630_t:CDS:1 n=1 Tax=Ambispora gerdemannii TaxID=144530 RepID=A0A9N9BQB2_9GLOM|nr:6630_t:CDS:10 [Ambispora gerdemannii]
MARGNATSKCSPNTKEIKPSTEFYPEERANSSSEQEFFPWTNATPPPFVLICDVSQILRANMDSLSNKEETENACNNSPLLQMEGEGIETIRKPSLFSSQVTETEQDIIDKRVALQQRQYAEFERREFERKSRKIRAVFEFLSDEEIKEALQDCDNDEEEVIVRMTQPGYLVYTRKTIAQKYHGPTLTNHMSEEQKEAYEQLLKKRKETLKKTTGEIAKKQYRMKGRLALDDALKQVQDNKKDLEKAFEGWSEARIKAFNAIDSKPNTYYYRFNAPGEIQKKGQWTKEEEALFFARLAEIGADGQWGIFSMAIPGRVGYQACKLFIIAVLGRLKDPNYVLDEKGKAHYLFNTKNKITGETEKTFRTHSKHGGGSAPRPPKTSTSKSTTKSTPMKKRRKRSSHFNSDDDSGDDFDFDDSGSYTLKSWSGTKRTRTRGTTNQDVEMPDTIDPNSNPLPGFVDPITLEEVIKPAISPYGHVMGYDSWVRCLSSNTQKNTCPLTKKPLTKRELVILTKDNIDEFRY